MVDRVKERGFDRQDLQRICQKGGVVLYGVAMAVILFIVFFRNGLEYAAKKYFDASNLMLLCIALVAVGVLSILYGLFRGRVEKVLSILSGKGIWVAAAILLVVQLLVAWNMYFSTGWDVTVVVSQAQKLARGEEMTAVKYFCFYPNNVLITWLFSAILKLAGLFGVQDNERQIFTLVAVMCLLSSIASVLLFRTIQGMAKRNILAWLGWLLFAVLAGLSPWMAIPYTDSLGLIFPILLLYLYVKIKEAPKEHSAVNYGRAFLIGLLAFLGYRIKPQILIMVIAILIGELVIRLGGKKNPENEEAGVKHVSDRLLALATGVVLALMIYALIPSSMGLSLNSDLRIGMPHFLMMGLNEEKNGIYSDDDVVFTCQYATKEERDKADLDRARERLEAMGFSGLLAHLTKKTLVNFNDGTFAWGAEGSFYMELFEDRNHTLSPFLKSLYYTTGENYHYLAMAEQMVWLFVLAASMGILGLLKEKGKMGISWVPAVALFGLCLFEWLFEARARYLYTYVPIFILVAVLGWNYICEGVVAVYRWCRGKRK